MEHFHLFRRTGPPSGAATLEMHSDLGLFIVMTAAEYFDLASGDRVPPGAEGRPESGFRLQLPGGGIVQPTFPDGCLLVMNGEGARLVGWLVVGAALTNEATQEWVGLEPTLWRPYPKNRPHPLLTHLMQAVAEGCGWTRGPMASCTGPRGIGPGNGWDRPRLVRPHVPTATRRHASVSQGCDGCGG